MCVSGRNFFNKDEFLFLKEGIRVGEFEWR